MPSRWDDAGVPEFIAASLSTATPQNCDISEQPSSLTPAELSAARDAYVYRSLVDRLQDCGHWWQCVGAVQQELAMNDSAAAVEKTIKRLAQPYARNHRPAQSMFQFMLIRAAQYKTQGGRVQAMLGRASVVVPPHTVSGDGHSRRAFRIEWIRSADRGLTAVMRRGAGLCMRCDTPLADARPRDAGTRRPQWRDYCDPCERQVGEWCQSCARSEPHEVCLGSRTRNAATNRAVKLALDAAAGAVLRDQPSRVRERRAKRAAQR
jgi:hypothetical protein